jgi:hypothetical protein
MVLVPLDTPGLTVVRDLLVFGYNDREGHCELRFDDVRVPATFLLGEEGGGFAMAQARLGPGRIHHCMRCIGIAERALELMCRRVARRTAFGKTLAEQGVIQEWIADSRIENGEPSDRVGCIRHFHTRDGGTIRERLLALSDFDFAQTYEILESPMGVEHYVATLKLTPVTDGGRSFAEWSAEFECEPEREQALCESIGQNVFQAGFDALKRHFGGR